MWSQWSIALASWLALSVCQPQTSSPAMEPKATFGVTVVDNSGFEGKIYFLKRNTLRLPNFQKMKPKGSIYTPELNVPVRDFTEGFPGVTKRFEWFALDYSGRFYIEYPGLYQFGLMSDDGSKLYIDEEELIDNDGLHPAQILYGRKELNTGVHRIRVSYFQGPAAGLGLVLSVAPPGGEWHVFNTREFRPANSDDWKANDATGPAEPAGHRKK